jgi:hypothetical protein
MQGGAGGGGLLAGAKGLVSSRPRLLPKEVAALTTIGLLLGLIGYTVHCVWVSADMYSAPSIVLQTRCASHPEVQDFLRLRGALFGLKRSVSGHVLGAVHGPVPPRSRTCLAVFMSA